MKISLSRRQKLSLGMLVVAVFFLFTNEYDRSTQNKDDNKVLIASVLDKGSSQKGVNDTSKPPKDTKQEPPTTPTNPGQILDTTKQNIEMLLIKMDSLIISQKTNNDFIFSYILYSQISIVLLLIVLIFFIISAKKNNEQKFKELEGWLARSGKENTSNLRVNDVGTLSSAFKDFRDAVFPRAINEITGMIRRIEDRAQPPISPTHAQKPGQVQSSQNNIEVLFADLMDQSDGWSLLKLSTQPNLYRFEFVPGQNDGKVTLNEEKITDSVIQNPFVSFPSQLCNYSNGNFNKFKTVNVIKPGKVTRNGTKVTIIQKMEINIIN